jgi:hypothetical protein
MRQCEAIRALYCNYKQGSMGVVVTPAAEQHGKHCAAGAAADVFFGMDSDITGT